MSKTSEGGIKGTEGLITQSEAARLKGTTLPVVNQWVRRGRVRSVDLFGRKLVYRDDVLAYNPEENKGGRPPKSKEEKASGKGSKKGGGKK
jgi:hypothetical protein